MNTDTLLRNWMQVTGKYGTDMALQEQVFNSLLKSYTGPNRHYHNLTHIEAVLADIDEYYGSNIPDELFFTAWFHDAVYNTLFNNNEARSATLAKEKLQLLGVNDNIINVIETIILMTANHSAAQAKDEMAQVFLDADMKILGVKDQDYLMYTKAVRQEFYAVPDMLFHAGRKKFLQKVLAAPFIYRTAKFHERYEAQARINLQNELNNLL